MLAYTHRRNDWVDGRASRSSLSASGALWNKGAQIGLLGRGLDMSNSDFNSNSTRYSNSNSNSSGNSNSNSNRNSK